MTDEAVFAEYEEAYSSTRSLYYRERPAFEQIIGRIREFTSVTGALTSSQTEKALDRKKNLTDRCFELILLANGATLRPDEGYKRG